MLQREFVIRIEDFDEQGFGIGYIGNKKIRIPGAVPGDLVLARKARKKKARIIKIIEHGVERKPQICPYAAFCGGCPWHVIPYRKQLEFKQSRIEKIFGSITPTPEIRSIIAAKKIYGYRGKMEFIVAGKPGALYVGLRESLTYDRVVDIKNCLLQPMRANIVLNELVFNLNLYGYEPYNILSHRGFLRYIVLRYSFTSNKVLANIITTSKGMLDLRRLVENISTDTLVWTINDDLADIAYGVIKSVIGEKYLIEKVFGLKFYICPQCFYQSNPLQAKILFRLARAFGDYGELAFDLYSGIGTLALIVSDNFERIFAIEYFEDSVKTAKKNISENGINNVDIIQSKVEDISLKDLARGRAVDTLFVDPPRPGIHPKAIAQIVELKPRQIVYISCNPATQRRDIEFLLKKGYKLELIQPIDMLPHTPHIETIALLYR